MKVAIINSVCTTSKSTGQMAFNIYKKCIEEQDECMVFYGRGKKFSDKNLVKFNTTLGFVLHAGLALFTGLQGYFSIYSTHRLISLLKKYNPDKVVLLNLHGYYLNEKRLWKFLAENNIEIVYIMPDEYAFLGKCCYANGCEKYMTECNHCPNLRQYPISFIFDTSNKIFNMKKNAYAKLNKITYAGPNINVSQAKNSMLLKDKNLSLLNWGIDTNIYKEYKDQSILIDILGEKYNQKNLIFLAVASSSDPRKGIQDTFLYLAKNDSKNIYINVGFNSKELNLPDNYIPLPYMNDQNKLAALMSMSDYTIIPSKQDTMPLVALMSLSCGTPFIAYNTSGFPYIGNDDTRYLIEPFNREKMLNLVSNLKKKDKIQIKNCVDFAEKNYSNDIFLETVYNLLGE